jgi:hypothetical protein
MTHIEKEGGVLATARKELAKLDAQLQVDSDEARKRAQSGTEPVEGLHPPELDDMLDQGDKGKGREQDDSAFSMDERRGRSATSGDAQDALPNLSALGTNAWESLQRFAHLPQVDQLQGQLKSMLHATENSKEVLEAQRSVRETLAETESLARRYMHDGEIFVQDMSKELGSLLNGLFTVVPPATVATESPADGAHVQKPAEMAHTQQATLDGKDASQEPNVDSNDTAATAPTEPMPADPLADDDFRWDDDDDEFNAPADASLASDSMPLKDRDPKSANAQRPAANVAAEDDSDWE